MIAATTSIDWKAATALTLAAFIAFALANGLGLSHAYWAPMSVWVVAQPYRDHVLERGVFRVVGTMLGAAFGMLMIWAFPAPGARLLLTCLWIAVWGGAQNLWHGRGRYLAFMTAMTAAVVVLPGLLSPVASVSVGLDRVLAVLVGVLVAMVIISITTPASPEALARREDPAVKVPVQRLVLNRDSGVRALLAGSTAGLGTLAFGLLGILDTYQPAEFSALGFAIFALILGGLQHPGKVAPFLFSGVVAGIVTAVVYRVGILPFIPSQTIAVFSLLPFLALGGIARSFPRTAGAALDANMIFLLVGQGSVLVSTDLRAVTVEGLSIIIAAAAAAGIVSMLGRTGIVSNA